MCSLTDFVPFSNAHNDICFVNQTKRDFWWKKVCLAKQLLFRALLKEMKSVIKHISFDLRKSHETSLTRLFVRFWLKQTFGGKKSV